MSIRSFESPGSIALCWESMLFASFRTNSQNVNIESKMIFSKFSQETNSSFSSTTYCLSFTESSKSNSVTRILSTRRATNRKINDKSKKKKRRFYLWSSGLVWDYEECSDSWRSSGLWAHDTTRPRQTCGRELGRAETRMPRGGINDVVLDRCRFGASLGVFHVATGGSPRTGTLVPRRQTRSRFAILRRFF